MAPTPANVPQAYFMSSGFTPGPQRSVMAFQPRDMQFSVGQPVMATPPGMTHPVAFDMNNYNRMYNAAGVVPNRQSFQPVLTGPETGSIASRRRNTTSSHNMIAPVVNTGHPNGFTTFSPSSPFNFYKDTMAARSTIPPSAERPASDNSKYLHLLPAVCEVALFDSRGNAAKMGLAGHLSGQFSLSPTGPSGSTSHDSEMPQDPSQATTGSEKPSPPRKSPSTSEPGLNSNQFELTFYRRNLFQVSCTVTNARNAIFADSPSGDKNQRSRIIGLSMEVSLSGTDDNKKPKLLYTPPKPDALKSKQEPSIKPLWPKDSAQSEVVDWKRLQFNSATLHNGRRRLQNYFTLTVSVIGELENRKRVRLVYANSRPIVVRGRNPRFYSNRQTIAISDVSSGPLSQPSSLGGSSSSKPAEVFEKTSSEEDEEEDEDTAMKDSSSKKIKLEDEGDEEDDEEEDEDKDDDYEYYQMPAAYYQPPVDVVYRPHAITHVSYNAPQVSMMPAGMDASMKRPNATVA